MAPKLKAIFATVVVAGGVLQFVQPDRTNPRTDPAASFEAVARPPVRAAAVVRRACKDCHSYETAWPWYSRISPVSWLVVQDVEQGRARLNLSEWNRNSQEMSRLRMREMCGDVKEGSMPLWQYQLLHPSAKLTPEDVSALCSAEIASSSFTR